MATAGRGMRTRGGARVLAGLGGRSGVGGCSGCMTRGCARIAVALSMNCKLGDISKLKNSICTMLWKILLIGCLALEAWFIYECIRVEYKQVTYANTSFSPLCVYGYSSDNLLSTTCYKDYNNSMAPLLIALQIGENYPVSRNISFFFSMTLIWPAIFILLPFAVLMDMAKARISEILSHIDTQMMSGVTQGIVYMSSRSVDDDMDKLYCLLRVCAFFRKISFALDKRVPESEGTRSYAISWSTNREPPNVDTKPHIIAGGRQGELIQRLLDMLHWYEAEGYVSDDWSDDITETNV